MNPGNPRWVLLARILRPRGNKGEVAAEILTDFPARLTQLREVFVGPAGGSGPRRVPVQNCWLSQNHPGQAIFHFAGVQTISEAEKFSGLDILLPIEQRVALPEGQYFVSDLVGCAVFELHAETSASESSPCSLASAPSFLGDVQNVIPTGESIAGTPVLAVGTSQGELLIPLARDICTRIDVLARRIEVSLPEGLRDLNLPG